MINSGRKADDGTMQSFKINMDDGTRKIRNRRFLKHCPKPSRNVQFEAHGNATVQRVPIDDDRSHGEDDTANHEDRAADRKQRSGPVTRGRSRTL